MRPRPPRRRRPQGGTTPQTAGDVTPAVGARAGLQAIARRVAGWRPGAAPVDAGELLYVACCWAAPERIFVMKATADGWVFDDPWPKGWWRKWDPRFEMGERRDGMGLQPPDPATYTRQERIELLARAGAAIAAEIDRLLAEAKGDDDG